MSKQALGIVWAVVIGLAGRGWADTLELTGGDRLTGKVESMTTGKVVLVTSYAGTLTIDRGAVSRILTDSPVKVALSNGDRILGKIDTASDGVLSIQTEFGKTQVTNRAAVVAIWLPSAVDPTLPPPPPVLAWKYSLAFDWVGKEGNSKAISVGGAADAVLSGPEMDLKFYAKGAYAKTDGSLSDRRLLGGIDFERRFQATQSWYVRDEVMKDDVQGIRFRNVLATGYGWYWFKREASDLRFRLGAGHTFTGYADPDRENDSGITIDSGARFRTKLGSRASWSTDVTFQPAVDDFANYHASHESKVSIPLVVPNLSQEFGVANQYESLPGADRKKLDTLYFIRTRLAW
jgi:hypothetical protein